MIKETDCFAAIKPFVELYADNASIQIVGGVGTAALCSPKSEIVLDARTIYVSDDFTLSTHRPDGTLRDVDVLVLTSDAHRLRQVRNDLVATLGASLEPSVFGIRPAKQIHHQLRNPLHPSNLGIFLGDRYESPEGHGIVRALFPFKTPLSAESLTPWTLRRGDMSIPVPNPATSLINYFARSISGLRPKDAVKVKEMSEKIFSKCPELEDYMRTGPLQNELEFTRVIASLAGNATSAMVLCDVLPHNTEGLTEHPFFMAKHLPYPLKRLLVGTAQVKAQGLRAFEGNTAVVTFWQRYIERSAGAITGIAS